MANDSLKFEALTADVDRNAGVGLPPVPTARFKIDIVRAAS